MEDVTILIAEDSKLQARMLEKRLIAAGYKVHWGENGAVAWELLQQHRPTLIISDIEMPEMNGYQFCEAVKSDSNFRTIPLILLSTLSDPEDIIKGLHAGADNYVTKPYEFDYLDSRVQSLLKTPLGDDQDEQVLDVTLRGKQYQVRSGRQQILNLLVSTFENAVEKNTELIQVNEELTRARDQLERWNAELEELNDKLSNANDRMRRDLDAAAKVQQSLLPAQQPEVAGYRFSWKYIPCDELAGDCLNVFKLDENHTALFVVDVSGHGVASSLLSVTIARSLTPHISQSSLLVKGTNSDLVLTPPAEVASELNRRFPMAEQGGLYFTMTYGILSHQTGSFRYVCAGHPAPIRVSNSKAALLPGDGIAIGWFDDVDFDEEEVTLRPGDRVYLYSDGIPEAMDENLEQFGEDKMLASVEQSYQTELEQSLLKLESELNQWCHKLGPRDDISILALECDE